MADVDPEQTPSLTPRSSAEQEQTAKRSLWGDQNFMLLWAGQSISEVGSSISFLALSLVAVNLLNASPFEIGLLAMSATLPYLLVSLHAGVIVDRRAKRQIMIACDVGRFLFIGSIPLVTIPGLGLHLTYIHLLAVSFLAGILTVFFDVSYQSYLPTLLRQEELVEGNGKLGTTQSFAHFAGPAIGGALVGLVGAARAITVDAISYVVSAASLLLIRNPEPVSEPRVEGPGMRHEIAEGLNFVIRHPILRKIIACTATSNLFSAMGFALEVIFLIRILQASPSVVGVVFSASALGGIIGGLVAGRLSKSIGSARIIWFSIIVLGLPTFMIPLAQPGLGIVLYVTGRFFFVAMAVVYNVAQISYRQLITPPEMLGRMNASARFITWGAAPIGAALGGVLGSTIGIRPTLWVAMTGVWAAGLWVLCSPLRKMRDIQIHESGMLKDSVG